MTIDKVKIIRYSPISLNALMVVWTMIVSPQTVEGDKWGTNPVLFIFPLIVILHFVVLYFEKSKVGALIYGLVHIPISFFLWIYCLLTIGKDAL